MATKTYNIDINVQSKTLGQLEDQLAEVNEELKQVDRNSDAFKNLTKQAQTLNAEINKTNKEIEGFTFEKRIEAADGAAKVFSGTLQGVVGTLGLLGVESEKFGEFEKKAASAIAAGLGIKDLAEGIGKVGPAFAAAGAQVLKFAKTTKGALISTGVGAFVVIVGTLVANWDKVTKAVENFAAKVPIAGQALTFLKNGFDKLKKAIKGVGEFLGITITEEEENLQREIDILDQQIQIQQARGASEEELFALRQELLQKELQQLTAAGADKKEIFDKNTELLVLQNAHEKYLDDQRAERHAAEMERRQAEMEKYAEVGAAIKSKGIEEVEITAMSSDEINKILTKDVEKRESLARTGAKISEEENEERRTQLMLTGVALETLSNIAGQETQAGKALASAGALINTYLAASDALKSVPFPFNFVAAAAVVANGLATVKRINETEVPGEGAGGMASTSPVTFTPPSTQTLGTATSAAPQIAPAQPTVRAYVVAGDTRSAAEAEAKIQARRTFGA